MSRVYLPAGREEPDNEVECMAAHGKYVAVSSSCQSNECVYSRPRPYAASGTTAVLNPKDTSVRLVENFPEMSSIKPEYAPKPLLQGRGTFRGLAPDPSLKVTKLYYKKAVLSQR